MRPTRFLVVLAVILVSVGDVQSRDRVREPASRSASSTTSGPIRLDDQIGDPDQVEGIVEVFRWALSRFETRGLDLPPMTVTFHRARARCTDFQGLWTSWDGGMRIDICVGGDMRRKRILLHELAHAWLSVHLGPDDRDAFVTRRGIQGWSGRHIERESQGIEQAAEIIVWGLDERCVPSTWLPGIGDDAELANEFERLTRQAPICTTGPAPSGSSHREHVLPETFHLAFQLQTPQLDKCFSH